MRRSVVFQQHDGGGIRQEESEVLKYKKRLNETKRGVQTAKNKRNMKSTRMGRNKQTKYTCLEHVLKCR